MKINNNNRKKNAKFRKNNQNNKKMKVELYIKIYNTKRIIDKKIIKKL